MTVISSFPEVQKTPLLVIFGPSGAGKSTLIQKLLDDPIIGSFFTRSVSLTTRCKRKDEMDGVHYHFVSKDEMLSLKNLGLLLESSVFCGNYYATLKENLEESMARNKIAVMDLTMDSVKSIAGMNLDIRYIFITAEMEELERRLKGRQSEDEHSFNLRMLAAKDMIEFGESSGLFNKKIVNIQLEEAYEQLVEFLEHEFENLII